MQVRRMVVAGAGIAMMVAGSALVWAVQLPLAPVRDSGQSVTPAYEGWYRNLDGTLSLSFGYFNRNAKEAVDIPVGPDNRIEPGTPNQGQPTHFLPRRQRGVFTVTVPADFGDRELIWTLTIRGESTSIPGHLHRDWELDALRQGATGNTPPSIKFDPAGPEGQGPRGVTAPPRTLALPDPLTLTVWATDDGVGRRPPREPDPEKPAEPDPLVRLTWHKHQGPGEVTFSEAKPAVDEDGKATTTATFSEAGEYVLRVVANDVSGENSGNQCCWTNGFVKVTVTQQVTVSR